jgi:hypothetical protein
MKALKINVVLNTTAGIQIPAGSVVLPIESNFQRTITNPDKTKFNGQFAVATFATVAALEAGKKALGELVSDFPQVIGTKVLVTDYETVKTEALAIKEVKQYLKNIFTGANDIEEINVILP